MSWAWCIIDLLHPPLVLPPSIMSDQASIQKTVNSLPAAFIGFSVSDKSDDPNEFDFSYKLQPYAESDDTAESIRDYWQSLVWTLGIHCREDPELATMKSRLSATSRLTKPQLETEYSKNLEKALKGVSGPGDSRVVPISSELEAAIIKEGRHCKYDFQSGPPTDESA